MWITVLNAFTHISEFKLQVHFPLLKQRLLFHKLSIMLAQGQMFAKHICLISCISKSNFPSKVLWESWGRSTFPILEESRVSHAAIQLCSQNRKSAKQHCCSSFPSHSIFCQKHRKGCFNTMGFFFFLLPLFPLVRVQLFWGNTRPRPHSESLEWQNHGQIETVFLVQQTVVTDWWFWNEKVLCFFFSLFFLSLSVCTQQAVAGTRILEKHYQIYSKYACHKYSSATYLWEERSKTT